MDIQKNLLHTEVGQGSITSQLEPKPPTKRQRRKKQEGGFISRLFNLGKGTTNKSTIKKTKNCMKKHASTGECMDQDVV